MVRISSLPQCGQGDLTKDVGKTSSLACYKLRAYGEVLLGKHHLG